MTESTCFHCGLDVPPDFDFPIYLDGASHATCCAGCQAVAQGIIDAGLGHYYTQRTAEAERAALPPPELLAQLKLYDLPDVQAGFVETRSEHEREAVLMLSGITCAACVWLIEQQLLRLKGVLRVELNYSTQRARVAWDNSQLPLSDILLKIQQTGYQAHPYDAMRHEAQTQKERKQALVRLWVAGLSMMQVMMYAVPVYLAKDGEIEPQYLWLLHWTSMVLTLPVMLYSAVPFYQGALRDWRNKRVGMDTPVAIAIVLAFCASAYALFTRAAHGVYFDSISMFVFLLLGGRYLEQMARRKAGDATERLVKLVPAFCHRLPDYPQTDTVTEAVVAQIRPGEVLLVKPGEVIPVDGRVRDGHSEVNEAMLTGESVPVAKVSGSHVVAGTLNLHSPLYIETEQVGAQTRLSSIVRLLDTALSQKPKMAELADRYASWFVAGLLLVALLTFAAWTWRADAQTALWITVSLLVITCPCALSLATPAALAAATGQLAGKGLLISRGHALEALAQVTDVVFDKTGTLTQGRLQLAQVQVLGTYTEAQVLAVARAMEAHSEHPIARAFADLPPGDTAAPVVSQVVNTVGQGIAARMDGELWYIGRVAFVAKIAGTVPEALQQGSTNQNASLVALGNAHGFQAAFYLQDTVKPEAAAVVADLQRQGVRLHLLSGDHAAAVKALAQQLAMDEAQAQATPEDKLATVRALQQQGRRVLMVGDGINDAPVLAQADVSVAVAGGADVAREGSDMVLLHDDLQLLPHALATARKTRRIIQENLVWALLYNLIAVPLAALGLVTPWVAALGMASSSLLVLLNALRLLRG